MKLYKVNILIRATWGNDFPWCTVDLDITMGQGAEKMKYVRTYITCISKKKRVNPNKTEF